MKMELVSILFFLSESLYSSSIFTFPIFVILSRLTATSLLDRITGFPLSGSIVIVCPDSDTILAFLLARVPSSLDPLVLSRINTVESTTGLKSSSSTWRAGSHSELNLFTNAVFIVFGFCFLCRSNVDFPSFPISVLNAKRLFNECLSFLSKTTLKSTRGLSFIVLILLSTFPFPR